MTSNFSNLVLKLQSPRATGGIFRSTIPKAPGNLEAVDHQGQCKDTLPGKVFG